MTCRSTLKQILSSFPKQNKALLPTSDISHSMSLSCWRHSLTIHYFKTSQPTKSQSAYTRRIKRFTRYRIIETHCQKTVIKSYQYCSIPCGRDSAIIVIPFSPVVINFGVSATRDDNGSCKNQSRFAKCKVTETLTCSILHVYQCNNKNARKAHVS